MEQENNLSNNKKYIGKLHRFYANAKVYQIEHHSRKRLTLFPIRSSRTAHRRDSCNSLAVGQDVCSASESHVPKIFNRFRVKQRDRDIRQQRPTTKKWLNQFTALAEVTHNTSIRTQFFDRNTSGNCSVLLSNVTCPISFVS